MTASEMRNRLDHRFRLLVGSRQGLERHHTLRHAVAWSYDLLDDAEKALLERCSVFTGGFDLESACAVAGFGHDEYSILDLPGALVRKSLLVADRQRGESGFRCWRRSASRRGTTRGLRRSTPRFGPPTRGTSPDGKPTSWPVGQPPAARGLHLVHHRTGQGSDAARYVNGTNMIIDNGVDCRNPHQPSRLLNDADSRSPAEHRRHVTRPRPASPASADRAQRSRRLAEVSTDGVSCNVGAARMSRQTSHHDPGKPCSSGAAGRGP